ncbi:MAG: hypothetical protein ACF8XB_09830, partial [Planctomycetota bacterium JB042]
VLFRSPSPTRRLEQARDGIGTEQTLAVSKDNEKGRHRTTESPGRTEFLRLRVEILHRDITASVA